MNECICGHVWHQHGFHDQEIEDELSKFLIVGYPCEVEECTCCDFMLESEGAG